jgi:hypothetical protein
MKKEKDNSDLRNACRAALAFIEKQHLPEYGIGAYRYSSAVEKPTLYSSTYAAMTRSLCGDLNISGAEKLEWADYLNEFQDDDGLFRDPVIFNQGWYENDPFWCGRPHLTCHVLTALNCLDAVAPKEFGLAKDFSDPDNMTRWLENRDWGSRIACSGNEIMNLGVILQYARDFHNDSRVGKSIECLLEWLATHHLHGDSGLWGKLDLNHPPALSHTIQAAYHWWPLFFYDNYLAPYPEHALDWLLKSQNPGGGFGWGVHNSEVPFNSSACEDIDSAHPIVQFARINGGRHEDVQVCLKKACRWVLKNQMMDGGFVFILDKQFVYGHPELTGPENTGAMFPTWFRMLCLAYIVEGLDSTDKKLFHWKERKCPGVQFK